MADSGQADVERVDNEDNGDNQPTREDGSPQREELAPDPSPAREEQLNKNEVRIKLLLLDGKDTTITCQVRIHVLQF